LRTICVISAISCLLGGLAALEAQKPAPAGVAFLAVDLRSHRTLAAERAERLDVPIAPGSVLKIATLAAAFEADVADEHTAILCTRRVSVAGHILICTHPDLHRPLSATEALAHSCNAYFATLAARLSRSDLDRALADLGLPPSSPTAPLPAAALGIAGIRATPRALMDAVARIGSDPPALGWKPQTVAALRSGMRAAATYGTASAFHDAGLDVLAKTGTTVSGEGTRGLVVGVWPASQPTIGFALLATGAAGSNAAMLAATRLRAQIDREASTAPAGRPMVRVGVWQSGGYRVRSMALEDYVAGVVAGEAAPGSSPAALEALATTVRTFAIANLGRHDADGFDLCTLTHCQVLRPATSATTRAASATVGLVLSDHDGPASVFYTASCGGRTERPSDVWPGAADPPFLPSRPDDACQGEPAWTSELNARDLVAALRAGGYKGDTIRGLEVISRTGSGRVARLRIDGFTPGEISGPDFRALVGRTLGWQHVKSTAFDLRRTPAGYRFTGHGSGHGVGLCVLGAARLAEHGLSVNAILERYFPGLSVSSIRAATGGGAPVSRGDPNVLVTLPFGDEGERGVVHDLAVRETKRLATDLGVDVPERISLRFHPSVESYQRSTGQPWFTAAASANGDVHFMPISVLRDRGILTSTLRHELVHILTAPALAGRPLWVREGAAIYFAGERSATTETTVEAGSAAAPCPADSELRHPVSSDALRGAYARASACFVRQLARGTKLREMK
jgi:stage II sporulation protein D